MDVKEGSAACEARPGLPVEGAGGLCRATMPRVAAPCMALPACGPEWGPCLRAVRLAAPAPCKRWPVACLAMAASQGMRGAGALGPLLATAGRMYVRCMYVRCVRLRHRLGCGPQSAAVAASEEMRRVG